ncbi:hypothetical protein DRO56_04185, partial [Candidatus Bathyarchaeota archaeon]
LHFNLLQLLISTFLQLIMVIIGAYYNRKTLELSLKDRERPTIVELMGFVIAPLREWLENQKGRERPEALNLEEAILRGRFRGRFRVSGDVIHEPPNPRLILSEFNILLDKLGFKEKWDEKQGRYNEVVSRLSKKINSLEEKLREIIENDQRIKESYDRIEHKPSTFNYFKEELVKGFYSCYRSHRIEGMWYYVGEQVFQQIRENVVELLKCIDDMMKNRDGVVKELMSLLEEMRIQLKKEYHLKPSEQEPLISFLPTHIH